MLMFSEASYNNDQVLENNLLQIFNNQMKLVSKIILDGIALGSWDKSIPVENVAMLYMGIPVSLNIEPIFYIEFRLIHYKQVSKKNIGAFHCHSMHNTQFSFSWVFISCQHYVGFII